MSKKAFIALLCVLLLFSSCSRQQEKKGGLVFTDDLGRTVTVEKAERTAVLIGSFAQIWTLGGGKVVAGPDDAWNDLDVDLDEDCINLGKINALSMEKLIASNPDFVLASPNIRQDVSWCDTLDKMGIPVAYFEVFDFNDYLNLFGIVTDITGRKDLYEKYGSDVKREVDEILSKNRTDSPKVLCLLASTQYLKAKNSSSSVMGCMLRDLGCINIADSESSLLENLSIEFILQENPDYIFITQRGDDMEGMMKFVETYFVDHPLWNELDAVKEGRVYFMEKELYNLKPNHRWGEAYRKLQEILLYEEK